MSRVTMTFEVWIRVKVTVHRLNEVKSTDRQFGCLVLKV